MSDSDNLQSLTGTRNAFIRDGTYHLRVLSRAARDRRWALRPGRPVQALSQIAWYIPTDIPLSSARHGGRRYGCRDSRRR
jgi:hypothetical protein